jgi:hypothetical protein
VTQSAPWGVPYTERAARHRGMDTESDCVALALSIGCNGAERLYVPCVALPLGRRSIVTLRSPEGKHRR